MIGGLCLFGLSGAMLIPENGYSILDIPDGLMKTGALVWALVPSIAGAVAAFSRTRLKVGFAFGVASSHAALMLAIATSDDVSEGMASGFFSISNEGLFNVTAILAFVLLGAALVTSSSGGGAQAALAAGGTSAAGSTGAQWAADPFGRHQMRYFNGSEWTAAVSDHGVVGTDPPVHTAAAPSQPPVMAPPAAAVPAAAVPPAPPAAAPPAPPAAPAARWCPNGHSNAAAARFCTQCGAPLS